MATTNFVDGTTRIQAVWLNAVDALLYDIFGGATTGAEVRTAISAMSSAGDIVTGDYDITGSLVLSDNLTVGGDVAITGSLDFGSITIDADEVDYDNTFTGIAATNVQDAIDEVITAAGVLTFEGRSGTVVAEAGDYDAIQVTYDDTTSGLNATNLQSAVDELDTLVDTNTSDISTLEGEMGTAQIDITNLQNTRARTASAETISGLWDFTTSPTINSMSIWHSGNLVKQSSFVDETAGSVMLTGAFGLGANSTPPSIANLNLTTTPSGLYRTASGVAGTLPFGDSTGNAFVLVERFNSEHIKQTYTAVGNSPDYTANRTWVRTYNPGTLSWLAWEESTPMATPVSTVASGFTLNASHRGMLIYCTNAGAINVTVPPHATVPFPLGSYVMLTQYTAGEVTVVPGAGVTLRSAGNLFSTRTVYSTIAIVKISNNVWVVMGDTD